MYGSQLDQDINCRTVGRCTFGSNLDREILDLIPRELHEGMTVEQEYAAPPIPLSTDLGRHFLYARYNADLSSRGLTELGFPHADASSIQKMDDANNIPILTDIGRAAALRVSAEHFGEFL